VCPGAYAEQVLIARPLTLKAVTTTTSSAVVIVTPESGLAPIGPGDAAHVFVSATGGPVTINGIAIDGLGASCPASGSWIGIAYGDSATGTITGSVIRNLVDGSCPSTAVQVGRNANVKIQNNNIRNVWFGITDDRAASLTIVSNTIVNATFGIGVGSMSGPLTISNNILSPIVGSTFLSNGIGIRVGSNHASTSIVSGNTVVGTNIEGIQIIQSDAVKVTANRISGAREAIVIEEAFGALVQKNVLIHSTAGLIVLNGGGSTVTTNTVNEAQCGIWAASTPSNIWLDVDEINCHATGVPPSP